MTIVIEQVLLLVLFAAVGFALSKAGVIDVKHTKLLSTLELYVFLPATVFRSFSSNFTVNYIKEKYYYLIVSVVILAIVIVAAHFISKLLTKDSYLENVYKYSLIVPNSGYMGYALAEGIFGGATLLNVIICAIPISFFTYTVGYCMLTRAKLSVKKLLNPVVIAIALGAVFGLVGIPIPSVIDSLLSRASACMAPVSMLLAGMVVSEYKFGVLLSDKSSYIVTAMRLIIIPSVISLSLMALGLKDAVIPIVMIYAMPCGLNTIVFPKLIGEDCRPGASLAFISNTLCCITIPLCLYLFT